MAQGAARGGIAPAGKGTVAISAGGLHAALLPARGYEVVYTPAGPVIGFAFDPQEGWHSFASDRRRPFRRAPNSLALTPRGCELFSRSGAGGEYLTLSASAETFAVLAEIAPASLGERRGDIVDAQALATARAIRRVMLVSPGDGLALAALAAQLCRSVLGRTPLRGDAASLTPQRRRIVEDYIEANLDRSLTVAELAGSVGLSEGFFIRAFRAGMGEPPHAYLRSRRLARARRLLEAEESAIPEIAAATGFASHAHLTAAFTRQFGLSPSAYRRVISGR